MLRPGLPKQRIQPDPLHAISSQAVQNDAWPPLGELRVPRQRGAVCPGWCQASVSGFGVSLRKAVQVTVAWSGIRHAL